MVYILNFRTTVALVRDFFTKKLPKSFEVTHSDGNHWIEQTIVDILAQETIQNKVGTAEKSRAEIYFPY